MTEWPNVLDSKSSEPLRVPRVQIPLSPPHIKKPLTGAFLCVAEREDLVWTFVQKIVWNDFSRPKGARRARRRDAPSKSLSM